MSNIKQTKDGLIEKSTGRKIVSPLDIDMEQWFKERPERMVKMKARLEYHSELAAKYSLPAEWNVSGRPYLLAFRQLLKAFRGTYLKYFGKLC